jgi:hypothetical protein
MGNLGKDGTITLKWLFDMCEGVHWFLLDRDKVT